MGKTRPSAIVVAAAYIALIAGLFLALGGESGALKDAGAAYDKLRAGRIDGRAVIIPMR